jgi:hypothetical protein
MKKNFKKLSELGLDLDLFYVISVRNSGIYLQGHATENTIEQCKQFVEFKFVSAGNWISGSKNGININLTF